MKMQKKEQRYSRCCIQSYRRSYLEKSVGTAFAAVVVAGRGPAEEQTSVHSSFVVDGTFAAVAAVSGTCVMSSPARGSRRQGTSCVAEPCLGSAVEEVEAFRIDVEGRLCALDGEQAMAGSVGCKGDGCYPC